MQKQMTTRLKEKNVSDYVVITRDSSNSFFLGVLLENCGSLKRLSFSLGKFSVFSLTGPQFGKALTGEVGGNLELNRRNVHIFRID